MQSSATMKALLAPLCLLAAVPLMACGKDDDDAPAPFESGVKEDGPVDFLELDP